MKALTKHELLAELLRQRLIEQDFTSVDLATKIITTYLLAALEVIYAE
jgi:hypothetical protein